MLGQFVNDFDTTHGKSAERALALDRRNDQFVCVAGRKHRRAFGSVDWRELWRVGLDRLFDLAYEQTLAQ